MRLLLISVRPKVLSTYGCAWIQELVSIFSPWKAAFMFENVLQKWSE